MYNIGIDAEGFNSWGGGIDFIATITEAIESTGRANTILIYPKDSIDQIVYKAIKSFFVSLKKRKKIQEVFNKELINNKELIDSFRVLCPKTRLVSYNRSENRFRNNINKKKKKTVKKYGIDILLPSIYCSEEELGIPQIGYLYDFQHKYLENLFDEATREYRDKEFNKQLSIAKYIIVNSIACKKDIFRFFPKTDCKIINLPFSPFQKPEIKDSVNIDKYNLPPLYYMISNQFWEHKNHRLAFHALEKVYEKGYSNIHIVCTGKMEDDKNPVYIKTLLDDISKLRCKDNIHLLGYIPKADQILIMKNSIGVIQPTLFEGGPGGGMVYNALCLGVCCLVSDIEVNREIKGYNTVFFFDPEKEDDLAKLMIEHMNNKRENEETINTRISNNKNLLGTFLLDNISDIIELEGKK